MSLGKDYMLGVADRTKWLSVLDRFTQVDVCFLPQYHRMHELNGDGEACLWVYEEENRTFAHCFMKREIKADRPNSGYYDLETVYGFGGPLSTDSSPQFVDRAWKAFAAWCQRQSVVAEFVRFNSLVRNYRLAADSFEVTKNRQTAVLEISADMDALWVSYTSKHRNMIRKAEKHGLVCRIGGAQEFGTFRAMYSETMKYNSAGDYFNYSDSYFAELKARLGREVELLAVYDQERCVATGLFYFHGEFMLYHLGASDISFRAAAPSNLMLHVAAKLGAKRGCRRMHLGGGRTDDPNDSLLKFKVSISKTLLPFYTGKRVYNPEVFDRLCRGWLTNYQGESPPNYFLLYRLPQAA